MPHPRDDVRHPRHGLAAATAARTAARQQLAPPDSVEARRRADIADRAERVRRACFGGSTVADGLPGWTVAVERIRPLISPETTGIDLPMEVLADPAYEPTDLTGPMSEVAVRIDISLDPDTVVLRTPDTYLVVYLPPGDLDSTAAATYRQLRHDGAPIRVARDVARRLRP